MGASVRRLLVMRHAKAESNGNSDHERELAASGHRDAEAAGAWLKDQGLLPGLILVSDATRTRQTYADVAAGSGLDAEPTLVPGLYAAGPDTALDIIREAGDAEDVRVVMVIGHNPTMGMLAQGLSDGEGPAEAAMMSGFPTASVAVLEFEGEWADLAAETCTVVGFEVHRA